MGEVYRARDTELGRDVAIKVLPPELAGDASRSRRFEREARSIARLDHPNLLAIHDIGRDDEVLFLVCELLDGEDLRGRLAKGPMTVPEVLDHAAQIASGLAAAHRQGVVHRDLKPANLFVTREGRVKILDFGLAKLVEPDQPSEGAAAPTAGPTSLTESGVVMGTVGYMSPEQIAGGDGDHRMDQFVLGIILYEMLAGEPPFQRATVPETLTANLREDPEPLERRAPHVPAPLGWIVERCLARDPEARYDSTGDLAKELERLSSRLGGIGHIGRVGTSGSSTEPTPTAGTDPPVRPLALSAIVVALLAVVALVFTVVLDGDDPSAIGIEYHPITFRRGAVTSARFDPVGGGVLYSAAWEGEASRIHLVRPQDVDALAVGPAGSRLLSVSPQGEILLLSEIFSAGPFLPAGRLSHMPISGAPRTLADGITDAAFGPDGELAAVVREKRGSAVLEFPPGTERLSTQGMLIGPRLSPRGDRLALAVAPQRGHEWGEIVVLDREDGEVRLGCEAGRGLAWSSSAEELWFVSKEDERRIDAVDLAGDMRTVASFPTRVFLFDVDPAGRVLLSTEQRRYEMAGRRPAGEERDLTWLAWSVPFDITADGASILFNEYTGGEMCRVALRGFDAAPPVVLSQNDWGIGLSPDGAWAVSVPPWNPLEPVLISTETMERRTLAIQGLESAAMARWLPRSDAILVSGNAPGESDRIFRVGLSGERPVPVTPEGISFGFFAVSPDGASVAALRTEGGVAIYPLDRGEATMLAVDGQPIRWSDDGRQLYTASIGDVPATVHRVDVAQGTAEVFATLMPRDTAGVEMVGPIAITPDGETCAYGYLRRLSTLQIVEGLR